MSAVILPFVLRASRTTNSSAAKSAPTVEIESKTGGGKRGRESRKATLAAAERLAISPPRYRGWLQQALIAAVLLHLAAFAVMHFQFVNDVERAANSGGNPSDGTTVLEIDIVADATLPPAKTPTNMTAPDATKQTNTPPQVKQEEKRQPEPKKAEEAPNNAPEFALPKEDAAPPSKAKTNDTPASPEQKKQETPTKQEKADDRPKAAEKKKKQEQADPSIAASPNRAAGNKSNNQQSGANGTAPTAGRADTSSYNALVLAHLLRFRTYPEQARASRATGVSTVRFTIGTSGNVIAVSLTRGSGASVLDQAALAMVRRASPFPPIPSALGRASMSFVAPVRFDLR